MEDVHLDDDQHLGRRSISNFNGVLSTASAKSSPSATPPLPCSKPPQPAAPPGPARPHWPAPRPESAPEAWTTRKPWRRPPALSPPRSSALSRPKKPPQLVAAIQNGELSPSPLCWQPARGRTTNRRPKAGARNLKAAKPKSPCAQAPAEHDDTPPRTRRHQAYKRASPPWKRKPAYTYFASANPANCCRSRAE